jgi:hypothetical protein
MPPTVVEWHDRVTSYPAGGVLDCSAGLRCTRTPPVKPYRGTPMTLGAAASAHIRLVVWCKDCRHQAEPDPATMATLYGADTSSSIGTSGSSAPPAAPTTSISSSPEHGGKGPRRAAGAAL